MVVEIQNSYNVIIIYISFHKRISRIHSFSFMVNWELLKLLSVNANVMMINVFSPHIIHYSWDFERV